MSGLHNRPHKHAPVVHTECPLEQCAVVFAFVLCHGVPFYWGGGVILLCHSLPCHGDAGIIGLYCTCDKVSYDILGNLNWNHDPYSSVIT